MTDYHDGWWRSPDGLRLHYRDYPGERGRAPILCVPGLTRNARDFAAVAERLAGLRRVIVVELRGRGESEWAGDPASYTPPTYARDVIALMDEQGLKRVVLFGTSLGGIVGMLIAAMAPGRLAGLLLNDVGPVLEPDGLARIAGYVGREARWASWAAAAAAQAAVHGAFFPDFTGTDWELMARRLFREDADGTVACGYDPAIAKAFANPPPPLPDPWVLMRPLEGMPTLLVRGGLTDLLSAEAADEMVRRTAAMDVVTVPRVGHAPSLDEAEVRPAIERLLMRVDGEDEIVRG